MNEQSDSNQEKQIDLIELYPEMTPVKSAPGITTMNGIGATMYGKRDPSPHGTYIKTRMFCILFFPLFAIDAYVVADAEEGGWYFLGKVPLSSKAKTYNFFLLFLCISLFCTSLIVDHFESDEYKTKQQQEKAVALVEKGDHLKAANICKNLILRRAYDKERSLSILKNASEAVFKSGSNSEIEKILRIIVSIQKANAFNKIIPEVHKKIDELIEQHKAKDPVFAINLYDLKASIHKNHINKSLELDLLKSVHESKYKNVEHAVRLALIYEADKKFKECRSILIPFEKQLNISEGARILGTIFLQENKSEQAYNILSPYIKEKLGDIQDAMQDYYAVVQRVREKGLRALNSNPNSSDYKKIDRLKGDAQANAVETYLDNFCKNNYEIENALAKIESISSIVPLALELGMLQLERARKMESIKLRNEELKAAEKTFLAISGFMGDNADYKLSLGQVYYWLGKSDQGNKIIDEVLNQSERDYHLLTGVANILRSVGEISKARTLAEEAYSKAEDSYSKDQALILRSVMYIDLDDQIKWLKMSTSSSDDIIMRLNSALGAKALGEGKDKEAEKYYMTTIKTHEALPENKKSYNNLSLNYMNLFNITGKMEYLDKSSSYMRQALNMNPKNSIVINNMISHLLNQARLTVIQPHVDLEKLGITSAESIFSHLYKTKKEKDVFTEQLKNNKEYQEALRLSKQLLVLAPQNVGTYFTALETFGITRDIASLESIQTQLNSVKLDLSEYEDAISKQHSPEKLEDNKAHIIKSLKKHQSLLEKTDKEKQKLHYSILASLVCDYEVELAKYGDSYNGEKIITLARKAYAANESSSSLASLRYALCQRALINLSKGNKDIAKLYKNSKHSLNDFSLLMYLISQNKNRYNQLILNHDIQEILKLTDLSIRHFPESCTAYDWASKRYGNSSEAKAYKQKVLNNPYRLLKTKIVKSLYPDTASSIMGDYLFSLMNDDSNEAASIMAKGHAKNLRLP